jgi:uncharacterized YceG family protein
MSGRARRGPVHLGLLAAVAVLVAAGCGSEAPPPVETGPPPLQTLTVIFPEGFSIAEMAARVDAVRAIAIRKRGVTPVLRGNGYLRAVARARPPTAFLAEWREAKSMEGFLFPASYQFTQVTTARELVASQLRAFKRRFGAVGLAYARSKNLTPYDILKIASMIEKETAAPSERKLVAAVIYNRLRAKMPLGIDATLRYGLKIPPTKSLTKAALRSDTPYNSRRFPGLPPTPIASPGLASLQAAAHPANVPYLFYVRIPNTVRHFFTADETTFLRKVCEFGYACN